MATTLPVATTLPPSREKTLSAVPVRIHDAGRTAQPPDAREQRLFRSLDMRNEGAVRVADVWQALARAGLARDDVRLRDTMAALGAFAPDDRLDRGDFYAAIRPNILLVEQALQGNLVVPDFQDVCRDLDWLFIATAENRAGAVADYIPQLSRVDPDLFGAAVCTVDGQRWARGDAQIDFCVQSCCKPINYCLALEEHGEAGVHGHVGREPSGRIFNELALSDEGKPHNPMVNAGAIMCAALVRQDLDAADRFDHVRARWRALCGGRKVGFNNAVYQSERQTADRNYALGYYMREHGAFPAGTDLIDTLEFYFQCCALEGTAETLATLAATLANGGVCPATGERVLQTSSVRHCLSIMCSCGMYDGSGEFAFTIGLPAKSGVGGALLVVVPNVMGLCLWSPRLDVHGNSVRGLDFCRRLVTTFNVHNYDNLTGGSDKKDPRVNRIEGQANRVNELIWAASKGDHGAIHRLVVRGFDQDAADYDRRTALHLPPKDAARRCGICWRTAPRSTRETAGAEPHSTTLTIMGTRTWRPCSSVTERRMATHRRTRTGAGRGRPVPSRSRSRCLRSSSS